MTDLLYKLKLKGKCVGYERRIKDPEDGFLHTEQTRLLTLGRGEAQLPSPNTIWHPGDWRKYDSIHPFVCKDRNGEDVFEGDWVKAFVIPQFDKDAVYEKVQISWDDERHRFALDEGEEKYGWDSTTEIELLEPQP